MKKKLLFVISQLYKGGAETSLVNLVNHLDYAMYDVDLLILNQCPVENAVSLIGRINENVKVCDAYAEYQKITLLDRLFAKFVYTTEQKTAYYLPALNFVRNKVYDWAFFVGEWYNPSFIAYEVQADIKAAWIHNDLSEAEYFDEVAYFYFLDCFDYFIFVSKNSMEASIKKYPFLQDRSVCIYNINDVNYIKKRAEEDTPDFPKTKLPVLLTCANFRTQKAHARQVKVMAELKRRGVEFIWVNIGATTDKNIVDEVEKLCKKENLQNSFLILGPKENPYSYIKKADAVTVLSEYESWSMVITEAKIIGTPVISTKTSGALEQIVHEETGLLTEFDVSDMADKIEKFLADKALENKIRRNISNFDNTEQILSDFSKLIQNGKCYGKRKREQSVGEAIIYVIDDINYMGGAHIATKLQIKEFLKQGREVAVFSSNIPNVAVRKELEGVRFLSWKQFPADVLFNKRLGDCLTSRMISKHDVKEKLKQCWCIRVKKSADYFEKNVLPKLSGIFSDYPIVCVMSEGSPFRKAVALSNCKKKIQWIHIDYCDWKEKSEWNRNITKDDGEIYKAFDNIVVLSENIKESFCKMYPHLKEKVVVNRNLIPVEDIKKKAEEIVVVNEHLINFVTVGRIDSQKAYPRLIRILAKLKREGYNFRWVIVGNGDEWNNVLNLVDEYGLQDWVKMRGELKNPFPEMKKADIFALLSDFEGIPNTIYEAMVLGIPALATDVGGVSTQINDGVNGWLVQNSEKEIEKKLKWLLLNQDEIIRVRKNIENYQYDNETVMSVNERLFSV